MFKKLKPYLVAFYSQWPGNGVGLLFTALEPAQCFLISSGG